MNRTKSLLIILVVLIISALFGYQYTLGGPRGPEWPLHVYDVESQDLGILVDTLVGGPGRLFTIFTNGRFLFLGVGLGTSTTFMNQPNIYFNGPNCTGDAFMSGVEPYTIYRASDGRFFVYKRQPPVTSLFPSFLHRDGGCLGAGTTDSLAPLVQINLPFTTLAGPLYIQ